VFHYIFWVADSIRKSHVDRISADI